MTWTLTRDDTHDRLELHEQFIWADEYTWQALAQSDPTYTLTGAIVVEQGVKQAGRPITLDGTDVWIKRKLVKTLQAWADVPELTFTLAHPDGRVFDVIFARPSVDNIETIKQHKPSDQSDNDNMRADLHFLTV